MTNASRASNVDFKFEIVVIPVSDVDRAKAFYESLGWRLDADFAGPDDFRVIQFTPPGSGASVIFGSNVTAAAPGSAQGLYLVVSDIEAARKELLAQGVKVSEAFHGGDNVYAGADEPYRPGTPSISFANGPANHCRSKSLRHGASSSTLTSSGGADAGGDATRRRRITMWTRIKGLSPFPVAALALATMLPAGGASADNGSASQAASVSAQSGDPLAGKLARRVVQRAPSSIAGREIVQVETEIPAGVESGWHTHPGEEVGFIIVGKMEMKVQGRAPIMLNPGDGFLIPPRTPHSARDLGPETGRMLSTYIVEPGKPLATFVEPHVAR